MKTAITREHAKSAAKRVAKALGLAPCSLPAVTEAIAGPTPTGSGRRGKGASGEREAAMEIMRRCPGLHAERNARNGKPTSDVVVWRTDARQRLIEIKRVESLDVGTKAMEKIRVQAEKDGVIGILWRRNREPWRLEVEWGPLGWVTVSGDSVWSTITMLVMEGE